jgi:hypothetical protein
MVENQINIWSLGLFLTIICVVNTQMDSVNPFDIYVLRVFQWYEEVLDSMNFHPSNCSLKIRKSIKIPTPKMGIHLEMCGLIPSHSPTLLEV